MKIEIKGRLKSVGTPEQKSEKFKLQEIVISRQVSDEFGEPSGIENIYPLQVVNDDITRFDCAKMIGKKVHATAYLNARENEGRIYVSIRLKNIVVLDAAELNGFPSAAEVNAMDDIPF